MPDRVPAMFAAECITQRRELFAIDVDDRSGIDTDHRIEIGTSVDQLVVRLLSIEQRLVDDSSFLQQFQRAIDRRLGDAVSLRSHLVHEGIGFEDFILFDDRIEDVSSFRSVFEILFLQVTAEDGAQRRHRGAVDGGSGIICRAGIGTIVHHE